MKQGQQLPYKRDWCKAANRGDSGSENENCRRRGERRGGKNGGEAAGNAPSGMRLFSRFRYWFDAGKGRLLSCLPMAW